LIFEMDGQTASEPRHWMEKSGWFGPKAWLVGQLAALREISRRISTGGAAERDLVDEQDALVWLLQNVPAINSGNVPKDRPLALAAWSNELALDTSARDWTSALSRQVLAKLSSVSGDFLDAGVSPREQALRAERLVLGLDRLCKGANPQLMRAGQAELSALFAAVQDRNAFDAHAFSDKLRQFSAAITPKK
jgi:hypothetical protein